MTPGLWTAPLATGAVTGAVMVPGSKSATNRAVLLAALADAPSEIRGPLEARDTVLMRGALTGLGADINDDDPHVWRIKPADQITPATEIECGLAGTVMRFVPPIAALAPGRTTFIGDEQARARPMGPLLDGLRQLGAAVDGSMLPFTVTGTAAGGTATIDASGSSQFVSGLLLAGARYAHGVEVRHQGGSVPSQGHIALTVSWLRDRGVEVTTTESSWTVAPGRILAKNVTVEPDFMTAAPFIAAALLTGGEVSVMGWPERSDQPGAAMEDLLGHFGGTFTRSPGGLTVTGAGSLSGVDLDLHDASELTPVAAALACFADGPTQLRGVAHIRGHETDRLEALATEITALGGHCEATDDGLKITPASLHGGVFHCYADHRLAHAGAIIGLVTPEVDLDDVDSTSKTMPGFANVWSRLVAGSEHS